MFFAELHPPHIGLAMLPRRKRALGANRVSSTSLSRKLAEFCAPDTVLPFLRVQVAVAAASVAIVGGGARSAAASAPSPLLFASADAFSLEFLRCVDGALGVGVTLGAISVTEATSVAAPPPATSTWLEPATLLRVVPQATSETAVLVHVLKGALNVRMSLRMHAHKFFHCVLTLSLSTL